MNRLLVLLAALGCGHGAWASERPFGWFGDLAGSCWEATLPDGKTHTQCYTTQFGHFMRGTATLRSPGAASPAFEGDSVFGWDPATRRIPYYIWGSDGSHRRLEASYASEELLFPVPSRSDPETIAFRSVWRRLSADEFEVRRERPDGKEWKTDLTVRYKRAPAAPPAR